MLSVTQKSTLSPPFLPFHTYPANHPSNKPTAKCSPSLPTLCTHSMPSTKLFNLLAIYYGSSLWDYRAASWNERGEEGFGGRLRRLRAIANKKGGKSTLLWHLILILLPYLSIDSGDCRGICEWDVACGMWHVVYGQIHFAR